MPTTSRSDARRDDQSFPAAAVLRRVRRHRHGRPAEGRSCGATAPRHVHRGRLRGHGPGARLADVPAAAVTGRLREWVLWTPAAAWAALIFLLSSQPVLPSPVSVG